MDIDLAKWTDWGITNGIKVIAVLLAIVIAWIISKWIKNFVTRKMESAGIDATVARFTGTLLRFLILVASVLAVLGFFGVETTGFAAILAAMGFAVGMAMQGALGNFASGVMMLIFRPFKVGDLVSAGGHTGTVNDIGLIVTSLDTPDNTRVIIPNSKVFSDSIVNLSYHDYRRVDVNVGTDYSASLDTVRSILQKAAESVPGRIEKAPEVFLSELGESSIDWQVRTWCDPDDYWPVWQATTKATKDALDAANIDIPYPQREVRSK